MNKSAVNFARDSTWHTPAPRPRPGPAGDANQGYHQSSMDLRSGLEISWQPLSALPEEVVAALMDAARRNRLLPTTR